MTNPLALPRPPKARPDYVSGLLTRTNPKPSLFTRLLERLQSVMSVALGGVRLVGEALIEARQMQREIRRRYPYFYE